MKNSLFQLLLWGSLFLIPFSEAKASHVSGGDIAYECVGPNTFLITLNLYRDCSGISIGTTQTLSFNSTCGGTFTQVANQTFMQEVSQLCPAEIPNSECNTPGSGLPGMEHYQYQTTVTLSPVCNTWTVSWSVCCRNTTTNVTGSPSPYFEATLNTATNPCNNSPVFTAQPIPYVCLGQPVNYNYGVVEPDGDNMVFSLIDARSAAATPVPYNPPYSGTDPITGITINPATGEIAFTPTVLGNFIVVVLCEEYDGAGNLLGTVMRDIQFVVQNCTNTIPDPPPGGITGLTGSGVQTGPNQIQMCEGDNVCFDMVFSDADAGDSLFVTSDSLNAVLPGAVMTITGVNPVTVNICWTAPAGSGGLHPLAMEILDNACPIPGLNSYTIEINVINSTYAGFDETICLGQGVQLFASGGSVFQWTVLSGDPMNVGVNFSDDQIQDPIANPAVTTTYIVTSNLSGGCVNTDTITVNVVPDFTYVINQSASATCLFDDIQIEAIVAPGGPGFTYQWTPATDLSDPNIWNPVLSPTAPGTFTYYLTITSPDGCVKQDSINVTVTNGVTPVVTAWASDDTVCGITMPTVWLEAQIDTTLTSAGINDDFDPGIDGTMWSTISNGTANNNCGANSGANALHFDSSTGDRSAETVPFNTAPCTTVDFCLFVGNNSSGGAPCENADGVSGEDIELQYSNDLGVTWITMQVFLADDWDNTGPYNNTWQCFSLPIPAAAMTGSTMFRWIQPQYSACVGCDNWSLDDVAINCSSAGNYTYDWTATGTGTVSDPTIWNPTTIPSWTTTYTVVVIDTVGGCSDTASVTVVDVCPPCSPADPSGIDISCYNGNDGELTATPNGFAPPYNMYFLNSAGDTIASYLGTTATQTMTNLMSDTYTIVTVDTNGCVMDTTFFLDQPVAGDPTAEFHFGPQPTNISNPEISFTNTSWASSAFTSYWDFAGLGTSTDENPDFSFPYDEPGTYDVMLVVTNANGCIDTVYHTVIINGEIFIYVPNAFTPDNDGLNDFFGPVGDGISMDGYEFQIFNRWGELIFSADRPGIFWDGSYKGMELVPEGVYVWKLIAKDIWEGEVQEYIGHVTVVR